MNCFFCQCEIPQYDSINNNLRLPYSVPLFDTPSFDTVAVCIDCRRKYQKIKTLNEFLICKVFKLIIKVYHTIKKKSNKYNI